MQLSAAHATPVRRVLYGFRNLRPVRRVLASSRAFAFHAPLSYSHTLHLKSPGRTTCIVLPPHLVQMIDTDDPKPSSIMSSFGVRRTRRLETCPRLGLPSTTRCRAYSRFASPLHSNSSLLTANS